MVRARPAARMQPVPRRLPVAAVPASRSRLIPVARTFSQVMTSSMAATMPRGLVNAAAGFVGGRPTPFDEAIRAAARIEGVDEHLVKAVVEAESSFNPTAVSPAGAKGLMQLMDGTARALGVKDPFDPAANLRGGARYLREMIDRFGSVSLALAAYNAGPGAVQQYGGIPPHAETKAYVSRVMQLQRQNQMAAQGNRENGGHSGNPVG